MQVLSERPVAEVDDGVVTVEKAALDIARENVLGVKLAVRSASTEPLTVSVVEQFPGHVSMSDVQAHPSYHPEKWTVSEGDHTMTFEVELSPEGSIETIYGVRLVDGDLEPFLAEPEFFYDASTGEATEEAGTPVRPTDDPAASSVPQPAPAVGEDEGGPDGFPEVGTAVPEPPERGQAADPAGSAAGGREAFEFGEDRPPEGAVTAARERPNTIQGSPSVDALVEALSGADLTDRQRGALREAVDLGPAESQRLQLAQLQSSVARLSAYADEFERFVDAVGSPAEAVSALRAANERLAGSVEELAEAVDAATSERATLRSRVDELEAELETVRSSLEEELAAMRSDLSTELEATADRLREELTAEMARRDDGVRAALIDEMEDRDGWLRDHLITELGTLEDRFRRERADELAAIDGRLEALESVLGAEEFAGIREVIAAERVWRDRLETARARRASSPTGER